MTPIEKLSAILNAQKRPAGYYAGDSRDLEVIGPAAVEQLKQAAARLTLTEQDLREVVKNTCAEPTLEAIRVYEARRILAWLNGAMPSELDPEFEERIRHSPAFGQLFGLHEDSD